eukprot:gene7247-8016_t
MDEEGRVERGAGETEESPSSASPSLLAEAEALRIEGNALFRRALHGEAAECYRRALGLLLPLPDSSPAPEVEELVVTLRVNLANSLWKQLRRSDRSGDGDGVPRERETELLQEVEVECRAALKINAQAVKALYRLVHCLLREGRVQEAKHCLAPLDLLRCGLSSSSSSSSTTTSSSLPYEQQALLRRLYYHCLALESQQASKWSEELCGASFLFQRVFNAIATREENKSDETVSMMLFPSPPFTRREDKTLPLPKSVSRGSQEKEEEGDGEESEGAPGGEWPPSSRLDLSAISLLSSANTASSSQPSRTKSINATHKKVSRELLRLAKQFSTSRRSGSDSEGVTFSSSDTCLLSGCQEALHLLWSHSGRLRDVVEGKPSLSLTLLLFCTAVHHLLYTPPLPDTNNQTRHEVAIKLLKEFWECKEAPSALFLCSMEYDYLKPTLLRILRVCGNAQTSLSPQQSLACELDLLKKTVDAM